MGSAPLPLVYERRHLSRTHEGDAYVAVDQKELLADLDGSSSLEFKSSAAAERLRTQDETARSASTHAHFDKMS